MHVCLGMNRDSGGVFLGLVGAKRYSCTLLVAFEGTGSRVELEPCW